MTDVLQTLDRPAQPRIARPRVGFLGVGWIGRHRMEAMLGAGHIDPVAVSDPSDEQLEAALALAPQARPAGSLDELLSMGLDGLVIATPSALHAAQARRALDAGVAVFCQKPLGRTTDEVAEVVEAARRSDRLLAVDLSYRRTRAMTAVRELVQAGRLGEVFFCDLAFHNAYGPDKAWFYDPALSGGGCVMDLGVHLVDLALWTLGFPEVTSVDSQLYAAGKPLRDPAGAVEDFAVATLRLATGAVVRLTCSWRLNAGQDAEIGAAFYGPDGGAVFENVGGSFYDFTASHLRGTARELLAAPPDAWGGAAAAAWAARLAGGAGFDPSSHELVDLARVLDRIYGR